MSCYAHVTLCRCVVGVFSWFSLDLFVFLQIRFSHGYDGYVFGCSWALLLLLVVVWVVPGCSMFFVFWGCCRCFLFDGQFVVVLLGGPTRSSTSTGSVPAQDVLLERCQGRLLHEASGMPLVT